MTADDHLAIERLLTLYCRALDRRDASLLATLFAPDAQVTLGRFHDGDVAGFVAVAMSFMSAMERTQHTLGNVLIEGDGDQAASEAHVHAYHLEPSEDGPHDLTVGARYLTRYARGADGWRITRHEEVMDWGRRTPSDGWFAGSDDMPKGERGGNDRSYGYVEGRFI